MGDMKLLHFSATWCVPCKQMAPMVKDVMAKHPVIEYEKLDIESVETLFNASLICKATSYVTEYEVTSVPTFILLNDDMIVGQFSGKMTKPEFEEFLATDPFEV
jgi:thioredoxin 1